MGVARSTACCAGSVAVVLYQPSLWVSVSRARACSEPRQPEETAEAHPLSPADVVVRLAGAALARLWFRGAHIEDSTHRLRLRSRLRRRPALRYHATGFRSRTSVPRWTRRRGGGPCRARSDVPGARACVAPRRGVRRTVGHDDAARAGACTAVRVTWVA